MKLLFQHKEKPPQLYKLSLQCLSHQTASNTSIKYGQGLLFNPINQQSLRVQLSSKYLHVTAK